jgi:hypothetical protein
MLHKEEQGRLQAQTQLQVSLKKLCRQQREQLSFGSRQVWLLLPVLQTARFIAT